MFNTDLLKQHIAMLGEACTNILKVISDSTPAADEVDEVIPEVNKAVEEVAQVSEVAQVAEIAEVAPAAEETSVLAEAAVSTPVNEDTQAVIAAYESGIDSAHMKDVLILAKARVNEQTTLKQAIEAVKVQYPELSGVKSGITTGVGTGDTLDENNSNKIREIMGLKPLNNN